MALVLCRLAYRLCLSGRCGGLLMLHLLRQASRLSAFGKGMVMTDPQPPAQPDAAAVTAAEREQWRLLVSDARAGADTHRTGIAASVLVSQGGDIILCLLDALAAADQDRARLRERVAELDAVQDDAEYIRTETFPVLPADQSGIWGERVLVAPSQWRRVIRICYAVCGKADPYA